MQELIKKNNVKAIFQQFKQAFLHFCYPTTCLHCAQLLAPDQGLFCYSCSHLLQLIDHQERCKRCFQPLETHTFYNCIQESPFQAVAAALDHAGPAATLIHQFKYRQQIYLAEGAGALMLMQFEKLGWPYPDVIVPVPLSWSSYLKRGYNQSMYIACALAKYLNVPVKNILRRSSSGKRQTTLSIEQRRQLPFSAFNLKRNANIADKNILLVDDMMVTRRTLQCCGEALLAGCPAHMCALTLTVLQ
jgi:ComF family protein